MLTGTSEIWTAQTDASTIFSPSKASSMRIKVEVRSTTRGPSSGRMVCTTTSVVPTRHCRVNSSRARSRPSHASSGSGSMDTCSFSPLKEISFICSLGKVTFIWTSLLAKRWSYAITRTPPRMPSASGRSASSGPTIGCSSNTVSNAMRDVSTPRLTWTSITSIERVVPSSATVVDVCMYPTGTSAIVTTYHSSVSGTSAMAGPSFASASSVICFHF
mmetsp:Transcript_21505/g.69421  ORF Transcript_21505/g.69421 Transcript_21505/m.69421 type:complete len:217 (-) Transcript_21505:124-774(-)